MSGHSKWAKIKHKKAATDSKRQAVFSRMLREITAIARESGGNLDTNARLRTAVARAKGLNMPMHNIENAIKKGTGELPGLVYENASFDVRGPKGVAILVECLTDNKNRTTAEVRNILNKKNGKLSEAGSTIRLFNKQGIIVVEKAKISEDELTELVLNAGGNDISVDDEYYEITCEPADLEAIRTIMEQKNIPMEMAEVKLIPIAPIKVEGADLQQLIALKEALEESEDVQNVYANTNDLDEVSE